MSGYPLSSHLPPLMRLEQKFRHIASGGSFAIAYSGGLDSRFLAYTAQQFGFFPELLHIVGPHVPRRETEYARNWATAHSLPYEEVPFDPMTLPSVAAGNRDRCYACKKGIFSTLLQHTSLSLCDGTNASDMKQYRPGIKAVQELGIHSPLAHAGLPKSMIHYYAKATNLEDWNQSPHPCLLTRLPYGVKPEKELLQILEAGEEGIQTLWNHAGIPTDFRLRLVSGHLEVHLVPELERHLSQELEENTLQYLTKIAPQFPNPKIRLVARLSGFFDNEESPHA